MSQLARPLDMSLSAVVQHLAVLESCGVVRSEKVGRTRTCRLEPVGLRLAEDWFAGQRAPGSAGSTGWARSWPTTWPPSSSRSTDGTSSTDITITPRGY